MTEENVIRHYGLIVRDLYELTDSTEKLWLKGNRNGTVHWDPEQDSAVFEIAGRTLTVPSAALDDAGLVAA